jgi:hypothetical protein
MIPFVLGDGATGFFKPNGAPLESYLWRNSGSVRMAIYPNDIVLEVEGPQFPPPITGERAHKSEPEKALPPALMTFEVCALLETITAIVATPTIARRTLTTPVVTSFIC